jgi:hypothetical protein
MSEENHEVQDKIIQEKLEVIKHIHEVRKFLYKFIEELDERAKLHDQSKLEDPEASIFGEHTGELAKVKYGTPEYEALLEKVKPAIEHHYANNRHHPEHWPEGVNDMTLVDLVEMLCDWKAATVRNKNGNIRKSVEHNAKRFGMSEQITKIFENTVREIFNGSE